MPQRGEKKSVIIAGRTKFEKDMEATSLPRDVDV
jgi:hypothetical protein